MTIDLCQAEITEQFNKLKHYWHSIQFGTNSGFSPLKTTTLSHGEHQQKEARISCNSSFGIKEVTCDSSFICCMKDKDNQVIRLLTVDATDPQFPFSNISFSNISVLKNSNLIPIFTSDPGQKKNQPNYHRSETHAVFRTQANKTCE